jgi:hypothetical protein
MPALARLVLATALALAAAPAAAQPGPDWGVLADEDVVRIVTTDEDGGTRETKIWIVEVDGRGFVRTGGTRWFGNIERDPNVVLKAAGLELQLRATPVEDEALRARIEEAFAAKYGWTDRLRNLVVFGRSNLLELGLR